MIRKLLHYAEIAFYAFIFIFSLNRIVKIYPDAPYFIAMSFFVITYAIKSATKSMISEMKNNRGEL